MTWLPLVAAACTLVLAAATARAATPSVVATGAPAFGRSAWTYSDLHDAYAKYEGGYAAFDVTSTLTYTGVPHGGYSTATDKCAVCHAVHRAESAFELTRGEWRGDACSYCHVGSAHSSKVVYDGNPEGMVTAVGHTIGASPAIPLSTPYYVSLDTTVVSAVTASGTVATTTVTVRRVDAVRNRMYRLRVRHGQSAAGTGAAGFERIGPLSLTCLSCHVAHGEQAGQWRPRSFPGHASRLTAGYKLLRAWPSGSIQGPDSAPYDNGVGGFTVSYTTDGQRGFGTYGDFPVTGLVDASAVVSVPETTLTPGSVGLPQTTWDSAAWGVPGVWSSKPATVTSAAIDPRGVDEY
ncbi:MAG: hypothetical protein C0418_06435, partial [Coriobacteriaceae bacterium]|nr:hypothetical protein [Coriobacteriaceae bacterium]